MPLLPVFEPRASRIEALLEVRPLYLRVETVNICNARCVFCAYPKARRPKTVMEPSLFAKIIGDYVEMGGGAVSLTPIVGDPLLDPHLLDRLRLLRATPAITRVGFISNLIAWDRFAPNERRLILESIDTLEVSTGGPDGVSYERMYAVDRFDKVCAAIDDICTTKATHDLPVEVHLGFRVDVSADTLERDPRLDLFRRPEIDSIDVVHRFGNWGGMVSQIDVPAGALVATSPVEEDAATRQRLKRPCYVHHMNPEITSAGLVVVCVCMNGEDPALVIGDAGKRHLRDIWQGDARRRLMASYEKGAAPDVCKRCSAYQDGAVWLKNPAMAGFTVGDDPWDRMRKYHPPDPEAHLAQTLAALRRHGYARVALYGAGAFTRRALAAPGANSASPPVAVIDDRSELIGTRIAGVPVIGVEAAHSLGVDVVVLASQWHADELWHASQRLRDAGVPVVPLVDLPLTAPD